MIPLIQGECKEKYQYSSFGRIPTRVQDWWSSCNLTYITSILSHTATT